MSQPVQDDVVIGLSPPDGLTLSAFSLLVLIGGGNFVAVSINVEELDPFWGAALRFGLAAIGLGAVVAVRRLSLPRQGALARTLLYGTLNVGLGYAFAYWALARVPAAIGSIVISSVPLATFLFAIAHRQERFRWRGLLGAVVAVAGIAVISGGSSGNGLDLMSLLALVGAVACFAEGGVVAKGIAGTPPLVTNALGMATGALILLVASRLAGEAVMLPTTTRTWVALTYLVLLGSIAFFAIFLFVLSRWTASGVSYFTVLIPIVTVTLSAWLQADPITLPIVVGGALVLVGVWVGALATERTAARR
ncbi:MAG TPA: EamA family transporter [Acidimicrobiia bacterium]|nr:EamA family transporter [Acidimicrobiia bacterium]